MPGANTNVAAYRRLRFALGFSLCLHLVALYLPGSLILDLSDGTLNDSHHYLTATLVAHAGVNTESISKDIPGRLLAETTSASRIDHAPVEFGRPPLGRTDIYEMDEVDVRPWIRNRVMPEYPPTLPPGIPGITILSFVVDETGQVTELEISQPASHPLFDLFAIEAFSKASYTPALKNRKPVKVRMKVSVEFNS